MIDTAKIIKWIIIATVVVLFAPILLVLAVGLGGMTMLGVMAAIFH